MGNRLSKIYTRTGDDGTTGLADGGRVAKDDPRVDAGGTVDELNSVIGMVLAHDMPDDIRACLTNIQHELFDLGGELSMPGHRFITEDQVSALETAIDTFNAPLPPLREFILPAGGHATASCHLARAVCRRAERKTLVVSRAGNVNPVSLQYLNRLSDLLFVIARALARHEQGAEVFWRSLGDRN